MQLPERVHLRNINNKNDVAKALGISTGFIGHMESIEKKRTRLYDDGAGNATVGIGHHAFGSFEKIFIKTERLVTKRFISCLQKTLLKQEIQSLNQSGKMHMTNYQHIKKKH